MFLRFAPEYLLRPFVSFNPSPHKRLESSKAHLAEPPFMRTTWWWWYIWRFGRLAISLSISLVSGLLDVILSYRLG
jgi:hypothetical protein